MLSLLKRKNPYEQAVHNTYAQVLEQVRKPQFYADLGTPDTFEGRFDLMLVHVFIVMHALSEQGQAGKDFNQALFDKTFADMDQTLRERGAGDMSVPKHMRRMMKACNGRIHAYDAAISDDAAFETALIRNLYGDAEAPDLAKVKGMKDYIQAQINHLKTQPAQQIFEQGAIFTDIDIKR